MKEKETWQKPNSCLWSPGKENEKKEERAWSWGKISSLKLSLIHENMTRQRNRKVCALTCQLLVRRDSEELWDVKVLDTLPDFDADPHTWVIHISQDLPINALYCQPQCVDRLCLKTSTASLQNGVCQWGIREEAKCLWTPYTHLFQRFSQLLSIRPTTNVKGSLNRRDNNSSNNDRRCW